MQTRQMGVNAQGAKEEAAQGRADHAGDDVADDEPISAAVHPMNTPNASAGRARVSLAFSV